MHTLVGQVQEERVRLRVVFVHDFDGLVREDLCAVQTESAVPSSLLFAGVLVLASWSTPPVLAAPWVFLLDHPWAWKRVRAAIAAT